MNEYKFVKEDFTEDELMLIKMAFGLADTVVEIERDITHLNDTLFNLVYKLGLEDIVY